MHILISGSTGFVGSYLQSMLINSGHIVSTLDKNAFPSALEANYDCLIHLAGRAHVMHETSTDIYQSYAEVNVDYMLKVADLAKRLNIKRFVFLSSIKVNGEASYRPFIETDNPAPLDAYGQTKLEAETALKKFCGIHGIEWVIIRPPLIYGPGVKANFKQLIKLCSLPLPLPFASVNNKRSFVSLYNLADFILLCSWHPKAASQIFLISDKEDVSTTELIKTIRQANKQKAWLIPVPIWLLKFVFKMIGKSGLSQRLLGNLQVDISKAEALLGWQPKLNFHEGIEKTIKK